MFNQRPAQLKSQSFSFVRLAQQAANKHQRNRVPQEYAEIEESEAQELRPVKNKDTLSRERERPRNTETAKGERNILGYFLCSIAFSSSGTDKRRW